MAFAVSRSHLSTRFSRAFLGPRGGGFRVFVVGVATRDHCSLGEREEIFQLAHV
jgi:hypothetical protein